MSVILTKYSDYIIHSIEFFIEKIQEELNYRDLPGIFGDGIKSKVERINVTKQHPLVALMAAKLNEHRNFDHLRSSIIPAISVTPGNMNEEGFTLGQRLKPELVDDDFINILKDFSDKTEKEIQEDVLISKKQIDLIISEYNRKPEGTVRVQRNEFSRNEEINISAWSDTPDRDNVLSTMLDSILAGIQVGFLGDNSTMRYFRFSINRGLTNFNYGRVLFGTEYNLTFLNSYNNYTIYTDDVVSGHDFYGTYKTLDEDETWEAT